MYIIGSDHLTYFFSGAAFDQQFMNFEVRFSADELILKSLIHR
jgi:hypothetical protein